MTRQIILAVIQASIEKPERINIMETLTRLLAQPNDGPRAQGNPPSTRFHLRGPILRHMRSWVQHGESPWDHSFLVYPQPPHRPGVEINSFQRAMFRHLTIINGTTTTAPPTPATVSNSTSTSRMTAKIFDADSSDTGRINTTAAVVFSSTSKGKVLQKKNSRVKRSSTSLPSAS